jgi:hypothetical protein
MRALWNVFNTFSQPRQELPSSTTPTAGVGNTTSNGTPPPSPVTHPLNLMSISCVDTPFVNGLLFILHTDYDV